MARSRIGLLIGVIGIILALLMLERPAPNLGIGPPHAIAAPTPAPATFASSCQGTIKLAGVGKPFSKTASTIVNLTTFSFVGTETDVEDGTPVVFSFTGAFGAGPGPVPGGTFTTTQTACTSCATAPCSGISMCKALVGHAELATQHFTGVSEEGGTESSFESNETVAKDRTILCKSAKSP